MTCLSVLGCGGSGQGFEPKLSQYAGDYEGTFGVGRPDIVVLTIDRRGSIRGTVNGFAATGFIRPDRFKFSYVDGRFEYTGSVIKDAGVQPFFFLRRK